MATLYNDVEEHSKTAGVQWVRFLLHFLQMQIAMGLGALVCYLLARLVPASSGFATVYHPGTYLFALGVVLYLTVPVVVWMLFRRHGWRLAQELTWRWQLHQ